MERGQPKGFCEDGGVAPRLIRFELDSILPTEMRLIMAGRCEEGAPF